MAKVFKEYFKIRPKIKEGESLSSYLLRMARENDTSFTSIIAKIRYNQNDGYFSPQRYYDIDINPFRKVDVKLLAQLLHIDEEIMLKHTLFSIISSLYSNAHQYIEESTFQLSKYFDKKVRKYCPSCLQEDRVFQLIWQIKDIKYCDIHQIPLTEICLNCNSVQPFISAELRDLICTNCGVNITLGRNNARKLIPEEQKTLITIWKSLLTLKAPLTEGEFGLSVEQSVGLKILYISQGEKAQYSFTENRFMSGQDKTFLKNLILGEETDGRTSYIGNVIRFLVNNSIPVDKFRNVKINSNFYQSMVNEKKHEFGNCTTPWCSFKDSNLMILSMREYKVAQMTHHTSSICGGCYITYGFNKVNERWEATGKMIQHINIILPLMKENISRKKMNYLLPGISSRKIAEVVGYMFAQNIIPSSYKHHIENIQVPDANDLLMKFRMLSKKVGTFHWKMGNKANELFGWTIQEFYCYFYQRNIQQLIYEEPNRGLPMLREYPNVFELVDKYIADCLTDKHVCSIKDFSAVYGIPISILIYYDLNQKIAAAKEKIKKVINKERQSLYWREAERFINKKLKNKQPFVAKDVYKALNKRSKWIYENCPGLSDWVNEQVMKSASQLKNMEIERNQKLIREAVVYLRDNDLACSKAAVARISGIGVFNFRPGTELGNYYSLLETSQIDTI